MKLENIFIISGPSGAGEDSVIEKLAEELKINRIITTTTRQKREGEFDSNPYYFITKEEFKKKIDKDEMAEWALEYNDNYYGVTKEELQRVDNLEGIGIWKMEYKGVMTASKKFPEVPSILLMAESLEELERRIRNRSKVTEKYIKERMNYTKEWMKHVDIYDYTVINRRGKLDEAVEKIKEIIRGYQKK
jgi:guanylate kinase